MAENVRKMDNFFSSISAQPNLQSSWWNIEVNLKAEERRNDLIRVINEWSDERRIAENRRSHGLSAKPSVLDYIILARTLCADGLLVQKHYLYACSRFKGDWCNSIFPFKGNIIKEVSR